MASVLSRIIATFGFVGYLPFIPGTFGSAAGLLVFWLLKADPMRTLTALAIFLLAGFLFSGRAERIFNKKDHKYIVIDEVCGMFISLFGLPWYGPRVYAVSFVIFRVLDTLKPFPACRLQNIRGSGGIMADDLIAGIYANLILQVVLRFIASS